MIRPREVKAPGIGRAPLSLRKRLVLGSAALIALVAILIGVVSVLSLQGFLVGRLDNQLMSASSRSQGALDGGKAANGQRPPARDFLALPGQSEGTIAGLVTNSGDVIAGVLGKKGASASLSDEQLTMLAVLEQINEPTTVNLGDDLGEYRMIMSTNPETGDYLIVGLPLSDVRATVTQLTFLVVGIGLLAMVIAAVAGAIAVRFALRPLERVASTATRVSELQLDRGAVALAERVSLDDADPRTEVGQMGSALNRLLEHVASALTARQASEDKVRSFVADASHELRTPLASIRGYAELTRRGNQEIPDDVAHAIGRIEAESIRMTGLVESLLLLARLDEAAPVEHRAVDLSRLMIDAVGDAHVAGPDHEWELQLPDDAVTVSGDSARLHQVVANLLANARIHTPAGTSVTASLSAEAGRAVIEVRDTGPGIAAELQPTVFERFVRGDSSRSRAAGSTGLGLAIVSAVVDSHGGTTSVSSEPGNTLFRVEFPTIATL